MTYNLSGHNLILRAKPEANIIADFVQAEIDILNEEWETSSEEAKQKALNAFNAESNPKVGIEKFLSVLLLSLGTIVSKKKLKELQILTQGLYDYFKTAASKKFKTKLIFEDIDKKLIQAFGKDSSFWINNFYNTFMKERINELSVGLLSKEFDRKTINLKLLDILNKEFGIRDGSNYTTIVPKRFAGNIEAYNEIVASTAAQRLKSFSSIITLYNGGYEVFTYTATIDKRTCSRCIELHGTKFAVGDAYKKVEAVANAENPGDFKLIMPWVNNLTELKELLGKEVPIPPIHGRCRCTIESA